MDRLRRPICVESKGLLLTLPLKPAGRLPSPAVCQESLGLSAHQDAHPPKTFASSPGPVLPRIAPPQTCPWRLPPRQRRGATTPPVDLRGQAGCAASPELPALFLRLRPIYSPGPKSYTGYGANPPRPSLRFPT